MAVLVSYVISNELPVRDGCKMGDEQRDGDGDVDGDDGGEGDETMGFQDMVLQRSEARSEPCPVRRLSTSRVPQVFLYR
jgi:hypothetical protein